LVFGFWGSILAGIIFFVHFLGRRKAGRPTTTNPEQQLQTLDSLRNSGTITDIEYQSRAVVVSFQMFDSPFLACRDNTAR